MESAGTAGTSMGKRRARPEGSFAARVAARGYEPSFGRKQFAMPDDEWARHKAALEAAGLSPELILEHLKGLDGLGADNADAEGWWAEERVELTRSVLSSALGQADGGAPASGMQ